MDWPATPETQPQQDRTNPDSWAVLSLTAGLGAVGFLFGPAMLLPFGWLLAVGGVLFGARSRSGGQGTAGFIVGAIAALLMGLSALLS